MADEQLDFTVRMLFPAADTREAEAALHKLQALAKSTQQSVAASTAAMAAAAGAPAVAAASQAGGGPGGYPAPAGGAWGWKGLDVFAGGKMGMSWMGPVNAPNAPEPPAMWNGVRTGFSGPQSGAYGYSDPRANATWATRPQYGPWNTSWGFNNGPQGSTGASYGPIRDPGSWAAASMQTARGYDQAMLRGRVDQSQQYYAQADAASGSLNKVAAGLTQITTAGTSLAAGLILLNKSIGENADAWDNMQTRMVGWLNVATGGAQGVRAVHNLSSGIGGAAARGANLAAGALNTAGYVGAAGVLGRMGAPLGTAGAIAGGAVVGAGAVAVGYMGYQLFEADRQLQESKIVSAELEQRRVRERSMMLYDRIGSPEQLSRLGIGLDADYNRTLNAAGAMNFRNYDRSLTGSINDLTSRNAELRSKWMGGNASDEGQTAGQETADNLELQIRLVGERGRKREEEKRTQLDQLNIEKQLTELEQARAGSTLQGMRGVTDRQWNRGLRLISQAERNGLDERTAMGIASITGGKRAVEWLDQRNQARIDALPEEWRDGSARSSSQLDEIKKRLKEAESDNQQLLKAIGDNATVTAGLIRDLKKDFDTVNRELFAMRNTPR